MSPEVNCPGWAPGLDIRPGQCVHCGVQKDDHPKHLRSRASGKVTGISGREFALADSPIANHPEVISAAASARKTPPNVVFCRTCNQGMVINGVAQGSQAEADYECPGCGSTGPKSLTPTGAPHGTGHERKPQHQKTPNQIAFEDGVSGIDARSPGDKSYMDWYAEGKKRRDADSDAANGAQASDRENILDAETEGIPTVPHETVYYADGSSATGPAPLPRVSPGGAHAIKVESATDTSATPEPNPSTEEK